MFTRLLFACCVALFIAEVAFADCYSVVDRDNKVVFRSTASPLDLSKPLSVAAAERFPGMSVIVSPDSPVCTEVDLMSPGSAARSSNPADLLDAQSTASTVSGSSNQAGTDVPVRGFYRKDGTYVAPYTRAAPGRGRK
jgi:hypothetical protein